MKNLILVSLAIFAIQFATAQTSLTKKEVQEVKKIVLSETPDYCFMLLPKEECKQEIVFKLESFKENGILYLQNREEDLIFVWGTIISLSGENFNLIELSCCLVEFEIREVLKDYWLDYALKNNAPVQINNRRAVVPFENEEVIIDFECQAGTIDYNKIKFFIE